MQGHGCFREHAFEARWAQVMDERITLVSCSIGIKRDRLCR